MGSKRESFLRSRNENIFRLRSQSLCGSNYTKSDEIFTLHYLVLFMSRGDACRGTVDSQLCTIQVAAAKQLPVDERNQNSSKHDQQARELWQGESYANDRHLYRCNISWVIFLEVAGASWKFIYNFHIEHRSRANERETKLYKFADNIEIKVWFQKHFCSTNHRAKCGFLFRFLKQGYIKHCLPPTFPILASTWNSLYEKLLFIQI